MADGNDKSMKRFSGEGDDPGKSLKRWQQWCQAKMTTIKDLQKHQRGPWIYTLLDGAAWDAVEHVNLSDIAVDGGDAKLWKLLNERFPQREAHDLMGEALGDVFALAAKDQESGKEWTARVRETCEQCSRRASVDFPSEVRGWIALNCAGLSEEQKAIIKAKTQGALDFETVASAFRSCFPAFKASGPKSRKAVGVLNVESEEPEQDDFADVEAFLAEHDQASSSMDQVEPISESEAAEALAVSWKERRQEISRHQQNRKFGSSNQSRRSFRIEVEELKKRTRCRKCNRIGHWAKECRSTGPSKSFGGFGGGDKSSKPLEPETANVGIVQEEEFFVGSIDTVPDFDLIPSDEQVPENDLVTSGESLPVFEVMAAGLVSSPGFGVVDSGCGRTLIGESTLQALEQVISQRTSRTVQSYVANNQFRFGNGELEQSTRAVKIPVCIGGKLGSIDAAVIKGQAPLLLGRPTLKRLNVKLDFGASTLQFLKSGVCVPMATNSAGQVLIDVTAFPESEKPVVEDHQPSSAEARSVSHSQNDLGSCQDSKPSSRKKVTLKAKECRCLLAQCKQHDNSVNSNYLVAELFSPPRFTTEAEHRGTKGLAFDLSTGYDLLDPSTQKHVDAVLDEARPSLLIVCPTCTYSGGWDNLNRLHRSPIEQARLVRQSRLKVRFCVEQIHKQLHRGGDFMFEHPWGSRVWSSKELGSLHRKFGVFRIDQCAYGLKCPDTNLPIQKATGLMVSRPEVANHMNRCPGCSQHRVVAGQLKSGQSVSSFVAKYPPRFVKAIVNAFQKEGMPLDHECFELEQVPLTDLGVECLVGEEVVTEDFPDRDPVAPEESSTVKIDPKIRQAIHKLHCNLGHPSLPDLLRILKHAKASSEAIAAAKAHQCTVCVNQRAPSSALPAKPPKLQEFNSTVGFDVKYLAGWKPNQRVPCVSIVDHASSLHVMAPIFHRETAEILKGVLRDSWIMWAGVPQCLVSDPAKPNISDALADYCEGLGITMVHTAAEAHWQNGKVERHGQWFEQIHNRICDQIKPETPEEFVECVQQAQIAKNSLISVSGASPYQLVFGRNPRVPQDLLQEDPGIVASEVTNLDSVFARAQQVRQAARLAVLECQDDRALRAALRARPRPSRDFISGDWVFYWRSQKWEKGELIKGGRWHGAAMVLGRLGRNVVVAHRRSVLRCAPEQLRLATTEEKTVAEFTQNELIGVKNLLERGQFPKNQFIDLIPEGLPPLPEGTVPTPVVSDEALRPMTVAELNAPANPPQVEAEPTRDESPVLEDVAMPTVDASETSNESSRYGPVRQKIVRKSKPEALYRLPESQMEDFAEMMQEVIPQILAEQPEPNPSTEPRGHKRTASVELPDERASVIPRTETDESLFVSNEDTIEVLLASFMQKRLQKELPPSGNDPQLQDQIDQSKTTEWETLFNKGAVRVISGKAATAIKEKHSDRFIGSRFVITEKNDEEGYRIKSRWCLQGHSDPDFRSKLSAGAFNSPTMSQLARSLVLQSIVSNKWTLCLGDIKGAFLESGPIASKYRPLFAKQPEGGIPGLDHNDVIEVLGNVYGSNDAPFNWWQTFDEAAIEIGWRRSQFDNCLYFLRDSDNNLVGILGSHVDDTITGGAGPVYEEAIAKLKKRFPYRKWRVGSGEFCGVQYHQDPRSFEITFHQKEYALQLRPIALSRDRLRDKEAPATDREIAALRAINGAANWLAGQSRPDLCTQTSFSQQCFPSPKVKDLIFANQLVHRARQYSDVEITVKYIPWNQIGICFHSDAGFANAKGHATQAGYILGFVDHKLNENEPSAWSPFCWKSYRLPRVVSSTLGAESQSFSTACAIAEWVALMLSEAKTGSFDLRSSNQIPQQALLSKPSLYGKPRDQLSSISTAGITDCKSLYDHLSSMSSVCKSDDKRVAIDLAIIKQCMSRTGMTIRWCPTELMLADGLTKDQADPSDLLRAALRIGEYQLNSEATVLQLKKKQREERVQRRVNQEHLEHEQRLKKLHSCEK